MEASAASGVLPAYWWSDRDWSSRSPCASTSSKEARSRFPFVMRLRPIPQWRHIDNACPQLSRIVGTAPGLRKEERTNQQLKRPWPVNPCALRNGHRIRLSFGSKTLGVDNERKVESGDGLHRFPLCAHAGRGQSV